MKVYPNEAGGQTVELDPGDSMESVPSSHRGMLTEPLRRVWANPTAHFADVAGRSAIAEMGEWLQRVTVGGECKLLLNDAYLYERTTMAGFYFRSTTVQSGMIALPDESLSPRLPEALHHFYSLGGAVQWEPFGYAGGILRQQEHLPVAALSVQRPRRKGFDPKVCVVWGNSAGGDVLIYTAGGKSALLSHESGKVKPLGTIAEGLSWLFRQLLENRQPTFD